MGRGESRKNAGEHRKGVTGVNRARRSSVNRTPGGHPLGGAGHAARG
ncbi:hypothetical protein [Streptomyces sp. 5-10]|nr:hypothetical protein [Streptomyces sp. 5-10]MBD3003144.1 hypothetical protein [Streptomyces sp. 5-10]